MTRWDRIGWAMYAGLLVVILLGLHPHWRNIGWLSGIISGAGVGMLASSLVWWPMLSRARKSRDLWIHNAMAAKAVLESLADIMEDGGNGKRVH